MSRVGDESEFDLYIVGSDEAWTKHEISTSAAEREMAGHDPLLIPTWLY